MSLSVRNSKREILAVLSGATTGKIGKVAGAAYYSVGDEALDKRYSFRCDPPGLAARTAAHPPVRAAWMKMQDVHILLEGEILNFIRFGAIKNNQTLGMMVELLSDMVDAYEPMGTRGTNPVR